MAKKDFQQESTVKSRSNLVAISPSVQPNSVETIDLLEQLLAEARVGMVTGLAVTVLRPKGLYDIKLRGDAAKLVNQMGVAGMLAALQKLVLELED